MERKKTTRFVTLSFIASKGALYLKTLLQLLNEVTDCETFPDCQTDLRDATQRKKTGFFGNFSQVSAPPPPPPLLGTPVSKKKSVVYFAF